MLDTSILIWWLSEPERLGSATADLIADPGNAISCSVVNLWEIQIKTQLGKLDLAMPLAAIHDWIVDQEARRSWCSIRVLINKSLLRLRHTTEFLSSLPAFVVAHCGDM